MDTKNEMIDLGLNPDDGSALMNGTDMPDGAPYDRDKHQSQKPVMTVNGQVLGEAED
jgi:hypothetical protein